jgi:hypothetical protein
MASRTEAAFAASSSAAAASLCAAPWRRADYMFFNAPTGDCGLNQTAHVVLSAVWCDALFGVRARASLTRGLGGAVRLAIWMFSLSDMGLFLLLSLFAGRKRTLKVCRSRAALRRG